jgi:1-acyl-sn-glycerol-3-phosphate acyltransferase
VLKRYDIDSLENRDPEAIERLVRWFRDPLFAYFRAEVRGVERVPPGAALYVGNHSSGMLVFDSFIFGAAVYEAHGIDAVPYGLGHEVAIQLPLVHQFVVPLGAVRACHDNAHRLFARGCKVIVYPGGDLDAMRRYSDRDRIVFGGRRGYMRLALREGVPIVPVIAAGSHETFAVLDQRNWLATLGLDRLLRVKVWPTTLSLPWGLTPGLPPVYIPYPARILMEILEPVRFDRTGPEAAADEAYVARCAERLQGTMQQALTRLARERRELIRS